MAARPESALQQFQVYTMGSADAHDLIADRMEFKPQWISFYARGAVVATFNRDHVVSIETEAAVAAAKEFAAAAKGSK